MSVRPDQPDETSSARPFVARPSVPTDWSLEGTERTASLIADIERLSRTARRIVSRGWETFTDRCDDTQYLAAKALVIDIATAVAELPESFRQQHPEVLWREIIGIRNRQAHTYRQISSEILWRTLS